MWPLRWIMRVVWQSRCALLLAYLSAVGLLAFHLAIGVDSTSAISGLVFATEASSLRKRSESELNFLSTASSSHVHPRSNDHELTPYFDNTTATNVTAELTATAFLHCRVRQLGDKVVSWLRPRDFHILTVGLHTYSSDQRFQMSHQDQTDDWTLQIKYTQGRDAGMYECQVNSDPPISHFVMLNVVVAKAEITGTPDMFFKSGSTITLTCLITQSPDPPNYVFWYHDNRMINYDSSRGGIHVDTNKGETTVSKLVIVNAQRTDSGNYTCDPANADPTSVRVNVLNGEKQEAIHDPKQSAGGSSLQRTTNYPLLYIAPLMASLLHQRCCLAR